MVSKFPYNKLVLDPHYCWLIISYPLEHPSLHIVLHPTLRLTTRQGLLSRLPSMQKGSVTTQIWRGVGKLLAGWEPGELWNDSSWSSHWRRPRGWLYTVLVAVAASLWGLVSLDPFRWPAGSVNHGLFWLVRSRWSSTCSNPQYLILLGHVYSHSSSKKWFDSWDRSLPFYIYIYIFFFWLWFQQL